MLALNAKQLNDVREEFTRPDMAGVNEVVNTKLDGDQPYGAAGIKAQAERNGAEAALKAKFGVHGSDLLKAADITVPQQKPVAGQSRQPAPSLQLKPNQLN